MSVKPVNGQCPEGYIPVMGDDGELKGCMPPRQRSVYKRDGEMMGDREGMRSADYFAHKLIDRFYPDSQNKKQLHYQIMGSFSNPIGSRTEDIYDFAIDDKNLYDASDALGNKEKEKELVDLYNRYIQIEDQTERRRFLVNNGASKVLAGKFIEDVEGDLKDVDNLITTLKQIKLIKNDQLMSLVLPDSARNTIKYIEDVANSFGKKIGDPDFTAKSWESLRRGNLKPLKVNQFFYNNDVSRNTEIIASKDDIDYVYGPEGTPDRIKYEPEVRIPKRPTNFTGIAGQTPQWTQRGSETEFDIYDVFPTGASSKGGSGSGSTMDERNPTRKDKREAKKFTELDNKNVPVNNVTPPPAIPPATPQGQVEFMQQQAQQMPIPNEVSSRTPLPQMTGGIPEAEQQVGMTQEEMPQENGSIFQRLRNLFSGKSPQPPQPSVAPQTIPQQPVDNRIMGGGAMGGSAMGQTAMPITNPVDNRTMGGGKGDGSAMNEMMPKEFQNAQNLGQQVTQPGMFGGGISDGGSMGQSATTGLSGAFAKAGESPIGTTGAPPQATAQTGALPQNVVDNTQAQTDITTGTGTGTGTTGTTGGGTPAPKLATPGIVGGQTGTGTAGGSTFSPQFIQGGSPYVNVLNDQIVETVNDKGVKSKSVQDLIEIGGTGFDDEVLARKLRRQAAMPELKNEDYYPNQPFTQAQTAWGDPIFSGAGALFPMAAYDAQRRARAQAEIDEAKRDVMQIKIPEIKTGAYVGRFRTDYIDAVTRLTDEYVKKYGSSQKAIRAMRQDGSLAKLQSQYEGIARSIDQTADRAKEFLKNAQEKSTTMYFSPEGVRAATNFMNGMGAYADGLISAEQLNKLEEQFNTAERWTLYKDRALSKFKPNDYIPTQQQLENPSAEDMAGFQAAEQEALRLKGAKPDFKKWIFAKKYSEAALPQVMSGIVEPFFSENSTAAEQLVEPGEDIKAAKLRVAQSIVDLLGRQIEVGEATQTGGGNTNVVVYGSGSPSKGTGIYHNTAVAKPKIKQYLSDNHRAVKEGKVSAKQALKQAYLIADASGSWQPDNEYMRVRIPGKWATIQQEVTTMPYSQMFVPTVDGGFRPYDPKVATGNPNAGSAAQPSHTIIIDTERAWMIPSGDGYKMVSQKEYEDLGMPEGAESYRIDKVNAYRSEAELTQSGGTKDPQTGLWVIPPGVVKTGTRNLGKIAYQIYPESVESVMDLDANANRAFNAQSSGGGTPKEVKVNVTNQVKEDFD